MRVFTCQNCGAKVFVSDLCATRQSDYICYMCADQGVTMRLVKRVRAINRSTEPPRIIHVTKQVIH